MNVNFQMIVINAENFSTSMLLTKLTLKYSKEINFKSMPEQKQAQIVSQADFLPESCMDFGGRSCLCIFKD